MRPKYYIIHKQNAEGERQAAVVSEILSYYFDKADTIGSAEHVILIASDISPLTQRLLNAFTRKPNIYFEQIELAIKIKKEITVIDFNKPKSTKLYRNFPALLESKMILFQDNPNVNLPVELCIIFDLDVLRKVRFSEKGIFLEVFASWSDEPVSLDVINRLMPKKESTLKYLIDAGLISYDGAKYFLHPYVAQAVRKDIFEYEPIEYLNNIIHFLADEDDMTEIVDYSKYIINSFLKYDVCRYEELFINFFLVLLNNKDPELHNLPEPEYTNEVKKMEARVKPENIPDFYNAIAGVAVFRKRFDEARALFQKGLAATEKIEDIEEKNTLVSSLLSNMATMEQKLGNDDASIKFNKELIDIAKTMPQTPTVQGVMSRAYNNLAWTEYQAGDHDAALTHFNEGLDYIKNLPETPENLKLLANHLNNLAIFERNSGDVAAAKKHVDEAYAIAKNLPQTPDNMDLLAGLHQAYSVLNMELNNTEAAQMHKEEVSNIRRNLDDTPEHLENYAQWLNNVALSEHQSGDIDSAIEHWEEYLKIQERLPETTERLAEMEAVHVAVGSARTQDLDFVVGHFKAALDLLYKLPKTPQNTNEMIGIMVGLGNVSNIRHYTDAARKYMSDAYQLAQETQNTHYLNIIESRFYFLLD